VLELDQDEDGLGYVADLAGAEHHPLQSPPPLGYQREAAFALAAHGAEQCVVGSGVRIELRYPCQFLTGTCTPAPAPSYREPTGNGRSVR
jgi:hypothetical protein